MVEKTNWASINRALSFRGAVTLNTSRRLIVLAAGLVATFGYCAAARAGSEWGYPSSIEATAVDPHDPALHGNCFWPTYYESPLASTYVTADLIGFQRDWDALQTFATADTPTNPVLESHNLIFVYQPGLRLVAGRWLNDCTAIEGTFIGLLQWDESRAVVNSTVNDLGTAGNMFSPFTNFGDPPAVGFDYNYFARIRVISEFNNAEINLRQEVAMPPSCINASALFGVRYINIRDRFVYQTESFEPVAAGTDTLGDVTARNSLIGLQIGGTLDLQFERRAWLNLEFKGMLFRNGTSQQTSYTAGPLAGGGATVTGSHAHQRATLGADLAATFVWQLSPSLLVRCGYQAIFLDGLALGSDNFLRNVPVMTVDPNEIADDGHLAYHGPFAGATLTW